MKKNYISLASFPKQQLFQKWLPVVIFYFHSLLFIQLAAFGLSCNEDPHFAVFPLLPGSEDVREQQGET